MDASTRKALYDAEAKARRIRSAVRKEHRMARSISPKADRGRIRDPGYLAFLRRLPCAVGPVGCSGPTEAAHIRFGLPGEPPTGLQRKPSDKRALPLCRGHHRDGPDAQHSRGERAWWDAKGIDPHQLATAYYVRYKDDLP